MSTTSRTETAPAAAPRPDPLPLHRRHRRRRCSASRSGLLAPDFAVKLKPIGTAFVALIKMMISPIIFCTIVLGVGSVASAAQVGKVGGLALGYFLAMSTVALAIGLVVGNLIQPGSGLHLTADVAKAGAQQAGEAGSTTDFVLGIIPTTLFSALTEGEVLQTLLVALLVGFAVQAMGRSGQAGPPRRRAPPARGVPGAGDDHVGRPGRRVRRHGRRRGRDRRGRPEEPGDPDGRLLPHLRAVRLRDARHDPQAGHRGQHLQPAEVPRPRVPADPLDLVLGVGAAAADGEDGARRASTGRPSASSSRPATRSTSTAPRST